MSDIYKLQYNGMTLAYPGWNGYISFEDTAIPRNVILNQQTGGTINAAPMSGYDGDVVTLSNTPAAEYTFGSYSITGATLTGNTFAFDGSDVTAQGSFTQKTYTLTLQTDGHGKLVASKVTGHKGDTVTLTPTYSSYYRFNNYSQTGGSISNNTFTFGSQNATAKANFKVNAFTARGNWEKGSNVSTNTAVVDSYVNVPAKYAVHTAHTGDIPASWYSTSNRWKPSNASAYSITLNPKMSFSFKIGAYTGKVTACSLIGSTQTQSQTFTAQNTTTTKAYNKSFTNTTQGVNYGISARLYGYTNRGQGSLVTYLATATTGTWVATGYAP